MRAAPFITAFILSSLIACTATNGPSAAPAPTVGANAPAGAAVLQVRGMSCPLCAHNIDLQLRKVAGVTDVVVDLGTGNVTAKLDRSVPAAALEKAVADAGFTVAGVTTPGADQALKIEVCSSCTCAKCACGPEKRCEADCKCGKA